MNRISSDLLTNTLNLVQLAREAAAARGNQDQVQRLSPVVDQLRGLATQASPAQTVTPTDPQPAPTRVASSETLSQSDFRALLDRAAERDNASSSNKVEPSSRSAMEKVQIVRAMGAARMEEVDIARQLGMTREEVRMILSLRKRNVGTPDEEVIL